MAYNRYSIYYIFMEGDILKINKFEESNSFSLDEFSNKEDQIEKFETKRLISKNESTIRKIFNEDTFFLISHNSLRSFIINELIYNQLFENININNLDLFCYVVLQYLFEKSIINEINFKIDEKKISLFSNQPKKVLDIHILHFFLEDFILSYQTSCYLNNLIDNPGKYVYVTKLSSKTKNQKLSNSNYHDKKLNQQNINNSFKKSMRKSNNVKTLSLKSTSYNVLFIGSRNNTNTSDYTINLKDSNFNIYYTNLEKTLFDVTVRPSYLDNPLDLIKIYKNAKGKIDIDILKKLLADSNFLYPYHQSIGFLLELTGHKEAHYKYFNELPIYNDFFIFYNSDIEKMEYNKKWNIYYPTTVYKYL